MNADLARWSLILLCFSLAGAFGGGLYEHIVLMPLWSAAPPSSFSIIQPGKGVPLQRFWIPVHAAITIFMLSTLILTWRVARWTYWTWFRGASRYSVLPVCPVGPLLPEEA
jgi:hypothetical protein